MRACYDEVRLYKKLIYIRNVKWESLSFAEVTFTSRQSLCCRKLDSQQPLSIYSLMRSHKTSLNFTFLLLFLCFYLLKGIDNTEDIVVDGKVILE